MSTGMNAKLFGSFRTSHHHNKINLYFQLHYHTAIRNNKLTDKEIKQNIFTTMEYLPQASRFFLFMETKSYLKDGKNRVGLKLEINTLFDF